MGSDLTEVGAYALSPNSAIWGSFDGTINAPVLFPPDRITTRNWSGKCWVAIKPAILLTDMKRILSMGLAGMALVPMTLVTRSASPMYINNGTVQCSFNTEPPPQIDAIAFVNNGSFCSSLFSSNFFLLTLLPYDFQNVLYYTNNGIMIGDAGYRFSHVSDAGQRGPSDTFFNSGTVSVTDTGGFVFLVGGSGIIGGSLFSSSRLDIWATNIINQGTLSAGPGGLIQLQGKIGQSDEQQHYHRAVRERERRLVNGFLAVCARASFMLSPTNFFPDVGLSTFIGAWTGPRISRCRRC